MSSPHDGDRRALREAAAWHVRLRDTMAGAEVQQAWQGWYEADPAHRSAWQRVLAVSAQLSRVPPPLARQSLGRRASGRRAVLRSLALGAGTGATAWMAWQGLPWSQWQAGERTATGERRDVLLPDGSLLALDTATAVDVVFDEHERLLRLHGGRILVATEPDPQGRPFSVQMPQGRVLALGTRFTVQLEGSRGCCVQVLEKAVRLLPEEGESLDLRAGEQSRFTARAAQPPTSAGPFAASWHQGGLIALDMPLGELVEALARYRPGYLGCAPEVTALRVSGAFPVDDTDRALAALVSRFPLQLRSHTRYWVQVEARQA
ncbi:MAG: FecR domain-containing protein [Burkholderiaceae bacterium]|jgi:transmembrane sensor|nr:FecR domain-containing protein [Burkholderiaceae bacterium]